MNLFEAIDDANRSTRRGSQHVTTAVVIGPNGTHYDITLGSTRYLAKTGITGLQAGDRVWVVMEWGSPKIIGLLGPDQNAPA